MSDLFWLSVAIVAVIFYWKLICFLARAISYGMGTDLDDSDLGEK